MLPAKRLRRPGTAEAFLLGHHFYSVRDRGGLMLKGNAAEKTFAKFLKALIDKLETDTYNKSTVWFLSTPIQ
jgi:hypothetical protein